MAKSQNRNKVKKGKVEWVILNMPFVCFLAVLAIVYISNAHYAERNMLKVQKLNKELQELNWRFKDVESQTLRESSQSQLKKKLSKVNLIENKSVPPKITISQG